MKKRLSVLLALTLTVSILCTGLAGCGKSGTQEKNLTKVTLNEVAHSIFYAPQYVAIEEGYFERHLNKTRALYKNRHDVLLACLREIKAEFTVSGENAGVHLLLHFHNGRPEEELIRQAEEKGVKVYGLSGYYVDQDAAEKKNGAVVLLGYANMSEQAIREAAALLGEAWKEEKER